MQMTGISAILLDIDGTLLDSNDAHARAFADAFAEHSVDVVFDEVRLAIGMGGDLLIPKVSGLDSDSKQGKAISERKKEIFKERYLPGLRPFPCARELLEQMLGDGFTLVVATSAGKDEVKGLLERAGVADLVPMRTSSDDAEVSKPAPDIVTAALERAGSKPSEAMMLGDTPYDVAAANAAGVRIVTVRTGGWPFVDTEGITKVYADLAELYANWDRSPFRADR